MGTLKTYLPKEIRVSHTVSPTGEVYPFTPVTLWKRGKFIPNHQTVNTVRPGGVCYQDDAAKAVTQLMKIA